MHTSHFATFGKFGYFGLLLLQPIWYLWLLPEHQISWVVCVSMSVPLLIPMHGMLRNNPYTFAWAQFIVLFYMIHAVTALMTEPGVIQLMAMLELIFTVFSLVFCSLYAKKRGQELGLSIRSRHAD